VDPSRRTVSAARRSAIPLAVALVLVASGALGAKPPRSRAERLFLHGKELYAQGHLSDACAALAESEMLEPAVGTLGLLASCHEKLGLTATAYREYQETARRAAAHQDDRERFALERAQKLLPVIPRLTILAPDEPVEVLLNDKVLDAKDLGVEIFLDPGTVRLAAVRVNGERWEREITLRPATKVQIEIPARSTMRLEEPQPVSPEASGPPWPSLVAAGVGVVGLGFMTGFGISALVQQGDSETLATTCRTTGEGCEEGRATREGAASAATIATVSFGIGAAGIGAAAAIWLVSGLTREERPSGTPAGLRVLTSMGEDGGFVGVRGSF
jgi:hypothetical protein